MAPAPPMQDGEYVNQLSLHPVHVLHGVKNKKQLVPLSASGVEQEVDRHFLQHTRCLLHASPSACKGQLKGRTLCIESQFEPPKRRIEHEFDVFMSQVTVWMGAGDGSARLSLAEKSASLSDDLGDWSRCWLFTLHGGADAVSSVVGELMRNGAIYSNLTSHPTRLLRIDREARVFAANVTDLMQFGDSRERDVNLLCSSPVSDSSESTCSERSSAYTPRAEYQEHSKTTGTAAPGDEREGPVLTPGSEEDVGRALKFLAGEISLELTILSQFRSHRHIVQSFGLMHMQDPVRLAPSYALQMEYCHGGSLRDYANRDGAMSETSAACVMKGLLSALALLHSKDVLHRNVNRDHIILRKSTGEWVLCGFGCACHKENLAKGTSDGQIGTVGYLAPEVIELGHSSAAADAFAAGVILYLVCMHKYPFGSPQRPKATNQKTVAGVFDFEEKVEKIRTEGYKSIVQSLLEKDPELRLSAHTALCNDWFGSCGVDTGAGVVKGEAAVEKAAYESRQPLRRSFKLPWPMPWGPLHP